MNKSVILLILLSASVLFGQTKTRAVWEETPIFKRILTEVAVGVGCGGLGYVGGIFVGKNFDLEDDKGNRGTKWRKIGRTCGCFFASQAGIYMVSKSYNKDVSYWGLCGIGVASVGCTALCAELFNKELDLASTLSAIIPVVSSVAFSNIFYPSQAREVVILPEVSRVSNSNYYGLNLSISL